MTRRTTSRRRFVTAAGLAGLTLGGSGLATARRHGRPPSGPRNGPQNFRAHLSGDEEVPPVQTRAQGQATFQLDRAGDELDYRLIVANIEDVFMAHVHTAPAGSNGPVVAWLYPEGGPPTDLIEGRFDGVLAESTLTDDDLVGPLDGGSIDDLIELLRAGEAYVNVHTTEYPAGELRGQIH